MRGFELRTHCGVNQWLEHPQIVTPLDLAKREDILPSLRQAKWDLESFFGSAMRVLPSKPLLRVHPRNFSRSS